MPEQQPSSHGLKFQARAIVPQIAETSKSSWIAGTNSLREENEVQILQITRDRDVLRVVGSYTHPGEVWCIAPSPSDARQLATVNNKGGVYGAAIYSLPEDGRELREEGQLAGHEDVIHAVRWNSADADSLATIEEGWLRTWRAADGAVQEAAKIEAGASRAFWTGTWGTKDKNQFCAAGRTSIQVWDLRSMKPSVENEAAHTSPIRDVDFAHTVDHFVASCGDDCRVKVWDLRSFNKPLADVASHAHWVWQVKFNPMHDQLLLSSSSDATVKLQHLPSLSRAAPGSSETQRGVSQRSAASSRGTCAASFDAHEDSVHGVAWSAADPWVFASVSYGGRVAISRVPSSVKYKVLI